MIWREKKWILIGLGAFLLVNVLFFVTYRVRYEERVKELNARLEEAQDRLKKARNERASTEQELSTYQSTVRNINLIYSDIWSTSNRRLAPLIIEVRQLASRSGITLNAVNYDVSEQRKELGASFFVISFGVQGGYAQVRRLINLIELSRQFVIIDEISLSSEAGGTHMLQLNLQLKTLFRGDVPSPGVS